MSFEPRDPQLTSLLAQAATDGLPTQQLQPATLPNLLRGLSTLVLGRRVTLRVNGSDCLLIDVQSRRILRVADLRSATDHIVTPVSPDEATGVLELLKDHLDGSLLMQLVPAPLPGHHSPSAPGLALSQLRQLAGQNIPQTDPPEMCIETSPGVLCHARVEDGALADLQGDSGQLVHLQALIAPLLPSLRNGGALHTVLGPQGQLAYPKDGEATLVVSVSQENVQVAMMSDASAQAFCNATFDR